jgi:hypothetical protein
MEKGERKDMLFHEERCPFWSLDDGVYGLRNSNHTYGISKYTLYVRICTIKMESGDKFYYSKRIREL